MSEWPQLEEDLREPVAAYLRDQGYAVRHEVWINGRIADLYAFNDEETVAVELKLTDWREATVQAMAYQLGALYTYIALPLPIVPQVVREASSIRRHGIGLLAVEPPVGGAFQSAEAVLDEGEEPFELGEPQVREVYAAQPADRYLPFLADKIVRDAKRPKRRPTILPMD